MSSGSTSAAPTKKTRRRSFWRALLFLLVILALAAAALFLDGQINRRGPFAAFAPITASPQPSATPSPPPPTATQSPTPGAAGSPQKLPLSPLAGLSLDEGIIYLSMNEAGAQRLFAYHPQNLPFTRLTSGPWDDIHPATSPDGKRLAFASDRGGFWDLYLLDLADGKVTRLTDTPEYEGSPSWSPDGQWLVYERYTATRLARDADDLVTPAAPLTVTVSNLEIFIQPVQDLTAGGEEAIRLTENTAADYAPAWSPGGRQIAFVSDRSGDPEIWLADLDRIEDRFRNLSRAPGAQDSTPAWSPDGTALAWASASGGYQHVLRLELGLPEAQPALVGSGGAPLFSPGGGVLLAALAAPNRVYLTGYLSGAAELTLPLTPLPGGLEGYTWAAAELPAPPPAAALTLTPAYRPALTPSADLPGGRRLVIPLHDVDAPLPRLQDLADESFIALRQRLAQEVGWDFLATLENAYTPLTSPLFPGMLDDWLYTGRAFAANTAPVSAGWMVMTREDFGPDVYWRIYLRARFQDGSQGRPLCQASWNLNARYSGDPRAYEQGGAAADALPTGYWLDFTALAAAYGWERLPALSMWRAAFPAARFNEFVLADGRDWVAAMLELYPPEALYTPTPVQPPTLTPTATRRPTRTPTPTRTPWPTRTFTPAPSLPPTRTATLTPAAP